VVRQIALNGQTRVLMTNLTAAQAPAHCFGGLYHQRWRIGEAFRSLKHRLRRELELFNQRIEAVWDPGERVCGVVEPHKLHQRVVPQHKPHPVFVGGGGAAV
jgi:hypothetical protein